MPLRARTVGLAVVTVGWLLLVGTGFARLLEYEAVPGAEAIAPIDWPANSPISAQDGGFTLVVAIHPRCPCSRASLEELARVLAVSPRPVFVQALVWRPASAPTDWEHGAVRDKLELLPGTTIVADTDGRVAEVFGLRTSGEMVLYDAAGRLLFRGGITGSRGHEGDNPAKDALLARLRGETTDPTTMPVFGCPIREP